MPLNVEDVLQANLVLIGVRLVNTPEEITAFRSGVGTDVTTAEAGLNDKIVDRTHVLNRDRIRVTGNPDRSSIAREYPGEADLDRLAEVAGIALASTDLQDQELRAYGYNIELVYDPDSGRRAIEYLSDKLFIPNLLSTEGWILTGGSGQLFFEKDGRIWQARLESRFRDEMTPKIFASLNLHRAEDNLAFPTQNEIQHSLKLLWSEAHSLVNQIHAAGKK